MGNVSRRSVLVSGLAAGAMVGLGRPAAAREPGLALTGVTVIDGSGARPRADQTVIIRGERIVAVGRGPVPGGARVVDLQGKYLIAGLCDLHVHSQEAEGVYPPLYVVNGVTTVRQMGG